MSFLFVPERPAVGAIIAWTMLIVVMPQSAQGEPALDREFSGLIDDVTVDNRALSADEIASHYRQGNELLAARGDADLAEYTKARERVATERRARLLADTKDLACDEIVFAVRQPGKDGHWYANFGYWSFAPEEKLYGDGGRLCRLNLKTGRRTVLLEDPRGGVRDPQVHYNGRKVLFSYREGGQPYYHLYEIDLDATEAERPLTQLTSGPFDDFEPTYLPDGDIVFCSSRCKRWVPCFSTHVAILYRCDGRGKNIRPLSSNTEQENTPAVLPDGRILYTRWEYVDRSQVDYHHLWTINPDGTGQMIHYGNQQRGTVMIDAVPIPGTNRVVCSFSPGHGRREHEGAITIVDPRRGPDEPGFAKRISKGQDFRDPYPIAEDRFLVARGTSILVMDAAGATTPIYTLGESDRAAGLAVHEPRPVRGRPREPVVPSRVNPEQSTGKLVLANVHHGRNMPGVKPGDVKRLLVLESLPKPVNFNKPGHAEFEVSWMEPVSIGGTFALARVLGTVPVESDGSAYFEAPALRSLFFVALDENDLAIKRMQSFVTVQPGETTSCVGCHESRTMTPPRRQPPLATERSASPIEPFADIPDVLDFPRDIQPILDRHCVECHNADRREGRADLSGDHTPLHSRGYWEIVLRRLVADGRNGAGNRPPRSIGASASPLMKYLDGSHHEATLSPLERMTVILWIESGGVYAGTYAAYFSGASPVRFPREELVRRCGGCHAGPPPHKEWEGHDARFWAVRGQLPLDFRSAGPPASLCNLASPEKSLILRAPLSRAAGGFGICTESVFADTNDPDYQKLLGAIQEARLHLARIKRFDMEAFCPNEHYLREMKRFGVVPPAHEPTQPLDPYATDQAYWKTLWYRQPR